MSIASKQWLADLAISIGSRDGIQESFERTKSLFNFRYDIRGNDRIPNGCIPVILLRNWQMSRKGVYGMIKSTRTPRRRSRSIFLSCLTDALS